MKKKISLFASLLLLTSLTACGGSESASTCTPCPCPSLPSSTSSEVVSSESSSSAQESSEVIVSVIDISLTSSSKEKDLYTISFSDGSTKTFEVKHGSDAPVPHIGENGNWWVGAEDTGIVANPNLADERIPTNNLSFEYKTYNDVSGLILSGFNENSRVINIPDYVGTTPVIGVKEKLFNFNNQIRKISLSKNTVYLGNECFANSSLSEIDFRNCPLKEIRYGVFHGSRIKEFNLPKSVKRLSEFSLRSTRLEKVNLENIEIFESNCIYSENLDYVVLGKNVKKLEQNVFDHTFIYSEATSVQDSWKYSYATPIE